MNLQISSLITSEHAAGSTPALSTADSAKLKTACQDFEGVFFGMMLKEMRKTIPQDTLLGDDAHEQEIFQGMMDDSVAKEMASHGGSDSLALEMYRQLAGAQASTEAPTAEIGETQ